ncbi:MAG: SPFH domain-containing protein [Candidatus Sumerlaeota bacterium]|nr:SPFH domain-containing protein [Candidatus Sumerlaeota bacterium]
MTREFVSAAFFTFILSFVVVPIFFALLRLFGLYAVVRERVCRVYVLFGRVVGVLDEPGLHFLPWKLGLSAFFVNWLGKRYNVDLRLDQQYLRSAPVNSEEGAPMGIGIWYEMFISAPVAFLFRNTDPRGSLAANVSNATVRCLSNMRLSDMLENRHQMSQIVRDEVTAKSSEWGYRLGSVYIRKVHFRDQGMIRQIEAKVVNRLRQVTAAIKQDGANQVNIITSTAEREAAGEFAKATALRPRIVGQTLGEISQDPEIGDAMFEILENQRLIEGGARVTLIPEGSSFLTQILAAREEAQATLPPPLAARLSQAVAKAATGEAQGKREGA